MASSSSMKMMAGAGLLRLCEQVADARRADADDRLDELRGGDREEGHTCLARDGAREQRLAGPGQPRQQHAVRDPTAEPPVLVGMLEEVDDLRQLLLRLVDAGDVRERDAIGRTARSAEPASGRTSRGCSASRPSGASARRAGGGTGCVGPKPRSRFCHHGAPVSSGSAFTMTPCCCSSCESASLSAKAGISVLKFVVGFESAYVWVCLNVPWIAVPFDVISLTWPSRDLRQEERAVRDVDAGLGLRRPRADVDVQREQGDEEEGPAPARAEPRELRRRRWRPPIGRGGLPFPIRRRRHTTRLNSTSVG